jgi:hypothetical protein
MAALAIRFKENPLVSEQVAELFYIATIVKLKL